MVNLSGDDDLRFGDVSGGGGSSNGVFANIIELFIQGTILLVVIYVFLSIAEATFNIPVPFI